MAKRRGSKKGNPFERRTCELLSQWWAKRDDVFWRTSGSGSRATSRTKRGKSTRQQYGDVMATDPIGEPLIDLMTIELKKGYHKETLHDLLDRPDSINQQKVEEWIEKAERTHKHSGAYTWAIIHERDKRNALIWMPTDSLLVICPWADPSFNKLAPTKAPPVYYRMVGRYKTKFGSFRDFDISGVAFDAFLLRTTQKFIENLVKRL